MITLQDAADHILKLPKAALQRPHWHAAVAAHAARPRRHAAGDEPWRGAGVEVGS
jgi:hypothetical protein